jgi:hypothetical protein
LLADIWVGRLKPTKEGAEGLDQLRQYLERNHAFRTGKLEFVRGMLILDDFSSEPISESESSAEAADIERLIHKIGLYRPQDTTQPEFMERPGKDVADLRQALQTPYELTYMNHHGTPTTQQYGQTMLTAADIERIGPKSLFYFIWSCSNGDFTSADYVAGSYLFEGNGLAVFAPTVPVFGNIESGIPFLFPLSLGATLGQAYQYANFLSPMVLLGDPTLSIRQPVGDGPVVQLGQDQIDFGEVPVVEAKDGALPLGSIDDVSSQSIEIKNAGRSPLVISMIPSFSHFLRDGQWETEWNSPLNFVFPDQIAAGESASLVFNLAPSLPGEYSGFVAFYTNDPRHTLVVVPFRGVARGERVIPTPEGDSANPAAPQGDATDTSDTLVLVGGCNSTADILSLEGPDKVRPQESVRLRMLVTPSEDLKEAKVRFELPKGIKLVEGEPSWTGALQATASLEREIVVSAAQAGEYMINGYFEGRTADGQSHSDCKTLLLIAQ